MQLNFTIDGQVNLNFIQWTLLLIANELLIETGHLCSSHLVTIDLEYTHIAS